MNTPPFPHPLRPLHRTRRWVGAASVWLAAGWFATLASGCAGVMRVDSQVKTHAQWPDGASLAGQVHYRFDRLPSQSGPEAERPQAMLEGQTASALSKAGWVTATEGDTPRWLVQVSARTDKFPRAPWEHPEDSGWRTGGLWAVGPGSGGRKGGFFLMELPYYVRHLSVVVRDTQTAQVAYETTATHDGRWNDSSGLWQAMADAALDGFPQPAQPQRHVNIDIPR